MSREILLGHVLPSMIDLIAHIAVALVFIGWWIVRYAGDEDAAARSEALPLTTTPAPTDPPHTRKRRFSFSALVLVIVLIVGTALPIWTAKLAFRAPVNAPPPPAIAGVEGE